MKIFLKLTIIFFIGLTSSCDDKSCDDVICGQNQFCKSGICYCADGYEGTNCADFSAEKYLGNYNISVTCQQGNNYGVSFGTIQADGYPVNELLFFNFLGLGQTATAYIYTDPAGKGNYLRFPDQNLGGSQIVGEGYYEDYNSYGRIRLEIQLTQNNQMSACTYTYY